MGQCTGRNLATDSLCRIHKIVLVIGLICTNILEDKLTPWHVKKNGGSFLAARQVGRKWQQVEIEAHCLACAKRTVVERYGGTVNVQGWHLQGTCGRAFLIWYNGYLEKECRDLH